MVKAIDRWKRAVEDATQRPLATPPSYESDAAAAIRELTETLKARGAQEEASPGLPPAAKSPKKRVTKRKPRPQDVGKRPTTKWAIVNTQFELMLLAKIAYPSAAEAVRALFERPGIVKKVTLNRRTIERRILASDRFSKLLEPAKGRLESKRPKSR